MRKETFNDVKGLVNQICSITGKSYDGDGNNAYPFKGRCSDEANSLYVITARIMGVTPEMIDKWGKDVVMRAIDEKMGYNA